jgi:hypothetical protein
VHALAAMARDLLDAPSIALFSPAASALYRAVLCAIALGAVAAISLPMLFVRTPYAGAVNVPIAQPIAFDHRHHVRDDGIDCVYCHSTVETDASAGMPSTARCMGCHGQTWRDSPELAALRASWSSGTPIKWRRVYTLPAHVYFHHGVHVANGVKCAECHGAVEDMPRVERVRRLAMTFCLDCHRARQGSRAITRITTCSACHR